jgi:hypothetical protein
MSVPNLNSDALSFGKQLFSNIKSLASSAAKAAAGSFTEGSVLDGVRKYAAFIPLPNVVNSVLTMDTSVASTLLDYINDKLLPKVGDIIGTLVTQTTSSQTISDFITAGLSSANALTTDAKAISVAANALNNFGVPDIGASKYTFGAIDDLKEADAISVNLLSFSKGFGIVEQLAQFLALPASTADWTQGPAIGIPATMFAYTAARTTLSAFNLPFKTDVRTYANVYHNSTSQVTFGTDVIPPLTPYQYIVDGSVNNALSVTVAAGALTGQYISVTLTPVPKKFYGTVTFENQFDVMHLSVRLGLADFEFGVKLPRFSAEDWAGAWAVKFTTSPPDVNDPYAVFVGVAGDTELWDDWVKVYMVGRMYVDTIGDNQQLLASAITGF